MLSVGQNRRTALRCTRFHNIKTGLTLRADDTRHTPFNYSCLFASDCSNCGAQKRFVIHRNWRDNRKLWPVDNIRRIKPPTKTNL